MKKTFLILIGFALLIGFGCSDKSARPTAAIPSSGCSSCHSDVNLLKATADPGPPDPGGEGSGEA